MDVFIGFANLVGGCAVVIGATVMACLLHELELRRMGVPWLLFCWMMSVLGWCLIAGSFWDPRNGFLLGLGSLVVWCAVVGWEWHIWQEELREEAQDLLYGDGRADEFEKAVYDTMEARRWRNGHAAVGGVALVAFLIVAFLLA